MHWKDICRDRNGPDVCDGEGCDRCVAEAAASKAPRRDPHRLENPMTNETKAPDISPDAVERLASIEDTGGCADLQFTGYAPTIPHMTCAKVRSEAPLRRGLKRSRAHKGRNQDHVVVVQLCYAYLAEGPSK